MSDRILQRTLLIWLMAGATATQAQPVIIGYSNCVATANYSQSLMSQIGQARWYFAHASVGECMMAGATSLHLSDTNFYQLYGVTAGSSPPGTTQAGVIYDDARGNPPPYGNNQAKLDLFQTAVSNGWHFPAVNIAVFKFCFIDIWTNAEPSTEASLLSRYLNTLTNLEAAYPKTLFVYATMPLTTTNYRYYDPPLIDEGPPTLYWRNVFNNDLRAWCSANNRVLFDLADIEAHDINGNLCTFTYNNQVCQQLWWDYTTGNTYGDDQSHPDSVVAESLMARGFYALAAATLSRWSLTPVISSISVSNNATIIKWGASAGHTYRLQYHSTASPTNWSDVQPDILALGPTASATNSVSGPGPRFYRVRLVQ